MQYIVRCAAVLCKYIKAARYNGTGFEKPPKSGKNFFRLLHFSEKWCIIIKSVFL